jgi:hypothetical protein
MSKTVKAIAFSESMEKAINQMRWQPETEWFETRARTDLLMFCNEAGQNVMVIGKHHWGVDNYLAHVRKVGMVKAAKISEFEAKKLMDRFTRAAIVAQECATAAGIGTLSTRCSDEFDFIEVSKWELKDMLKSAYTRGLQDGMDDADAEA